MLLGLFEFLMWFQPPPSSSGAAGSAGGAGGAAGAPGAVPPGCDAVSLGMMVAIIAIFYVVLIRPDSKRRKERESMLGALKVGDVVRTSGGIRGEITRMSDTDATLEVADRVRINVLRSYIAGVDPNQDSDGDSSKGSEA